MVLALLGLPSARLTLEERLVAFRGNERWDGSCDDLLDGLSDGLDVGIGVERGLDTVSVGEKHPTVSVSRTVAILLVKSLFKFSIDSFPV